MKPNLMLLIVPSLTGVAVTAKSHSFQTPPMGGDRPRSSVQPALPAFIERENVVRSLDGIDQSAREITVLECPILLVLHTRREAARRADQ